MYWVFVPPLYGQIRGLPWLENVLLNYPPMQALFTDKNTTINLPRGFVIDGIEAKRKIIESWQQGIISGKIRSQNERKLQSEFLNKIFGEVLGYSYEKHLDQWQLDNEVKVDMDGKTPDGALGYFNFDSKTTSNDIRVVIELKGPLINLDKKQNRVDFKGTPVEQAFSYVPKLNSPCNWVIVSNCLEIRLYRYQLGMSTYERFDLLNLLDNGKLQYFCLLLQQGQLFLANQPSPVERIFEERQDALKNITNEFYAGYKLQREYLFEQLRKHNPDVLPNDLLRCTQKIIDRLIFMCFARDLSLVRNMIEAVTNAAGESFGQEDNKIWQELRKAFIALDIGYKSKNIPPFNGGLFKKDTVLDALVVADFRLQDVMNFLNSYDYMSQLNVNILGHIFEQSISDLEEMKTAPSGGSGASKRKKDGVFYTPDYITRYMVAQSVGGWIDERELDILQNLGVEHLPELTDDDYRSVCLSSKGVYERNNNIALHVAFWEHYEAALKNLRVLDPACGSGAFLTEVFDFLYVKWQIMKEELWRLVTPYDKQLRELATSTSALTMGVSKFNEWEIKKNIISNNLYGVDLNPESVEITKLSLWLKTANKNESLASLIENIQQGNSLIDDPAVGGADAFDWNANFKTIMAAGGFDVVVGNPPYLGGREWKEEFGKRQTYFMNQYEVADYQFDMYVLFWEKCVLLSKNEKGFVSLITPNTWLNNQSNLKLRSFILANTHIRSIVDYTQIKVFEDAVVLPIIVTLKKYDPLQGFKTLVRDRTTKLYKATKPAEIKLLSAINQQIWNDDELKIINIDIREEDIAIRLKIETDATKVEDLADVKFGVKIYETNKGNPKQTADDAKNKTYEADKQIDSNYRKFLEGKDIQQYEINWQNRWLKYGDNLAAKREPSLFEGERILVRRIVGERLIGAYTNQDYVSNQLLQIVKPHEPKQTKHLLGLLNSTLMAYYFRKKYNRQEKTFPEIRIYELCSLPIKLSDNEHIAEKVDVSIHLNQSLHQQSQSFLELVAANYALKANTKLKHWYELDFKELLAELGKQNTKIPLAKQAELKAYFEAEQTKILSLKNNIAQTDREIDSLVYALYGLTAAEIAVVES